MTFGPARTIATICARGGSKGLPRKNVRLFAGLPLIAHSITQALQCQHVDGVYVSTDDEEIAEIARDFGATVPFIRPAALAQDETPKLPVIAHLIEYLELQGHRIDRILDLQPTSPLRTPQDLTGALELDPSADLVVSICEPSHNPYFTLVESDEEGCLQLCKPSRFVCRQQAPSVWGLNGSIYVWRPAALLQAISNGFWTVSTRGFVMPRERSVDIDDAFDFELAEWLVTRMHNVE